MGKLRTLERRIGVVGLYNTGKTVFLTSLINHLKDHDPDRFRLGRRKAVIRKFSQRAIDQRWRPFEYDDHRLRLVTCGRWPMKTIDRSQFVCRFERTDWWHNVTLKLFDLPGERVADIGMANNDFAAWSDRLLGHLESDEPSRQCFGEFLRSVQSADLCDETRLLDDYRVGLAGLVQGYHPCISPSTFLLNREGVLARTRTVEGELPAQAIAAERYAGLDANSQFAPLPAPVRRTQSELAARFAFRFKAYRDELVLPWVRALKSCHALVCLVDVLELLASGPAMYNGCGQVLRDLLDVLDPGQSPLGGAARTVSGLFLPHAWRPRRITRIAFVAPKLDLVPSKDRGRMIDLVRDLAGGPARDRDGVQTLFTNCSAAYSTNEFPRDGEQRVLCGRVGDGEHWFAVPPLPECWPPNWRAGEFVFPRVRPAVPARKDCPPQQVNLDQVFDFVMG